MKTYHVHVTIQLKDGVLDTQGKAVERSLHSLGYEGLQSVKVGKYIQLWITGESEDQARREAERMCDDLLVNGIIEQFRVDVEETA